MEIKAPTKKGKTLMGELGMGDLFRLLDDAPDDVRMMDDEGGYVSLYSGVRFIVDDELEVLRVKGYFQET